MRARFALSAAVAAGLFLTACQTTENRAAYEKPLVAQAAPEMAQDEDAQSYPFEIADLKPQHRPDPNSDEAGWWMSVDKVEARTKTAGNLVHDEELNRYLQEVVCRVAGDYCGDIRVYVMQVPAFNATMYPNGMMHIWTGLLLRVQNEAQLAAVIGHEISHYLRQHTVQRMRDAIEKTNVVAFLSVVFPLAGDVAALATLGSLASYGRDQEREADGYGLLLVGRSGYNPQETWRMWQRIDREKKADEDDGDSDSFAASHPATEERLEALRDLAARVPMTTLGETGRDRFQRILLPRRAALIEDELHWRRFDTLEALLDILIEDGHNIAELHFFKGELYRLRKKDGDLEKAVQSYKSAFRTGSPPTEIHRSLGLVYWALGRKPEAAESFRRYLAAVPDAEDARMIQNMVGKAGV